MQHALFNYSHSIQHEITEATITQLYYESDTWKRLLDFIMEENIHQKNRLSEVIKHSFEKDAIDAMENFQIKFIKEDVQIKYLRNQILELDKSLEKALVKETKSLSPNHDIDYLQQHLRDDIIALKTNSCDLKIEFNHYLLENCL